ncbi:Serine/threonine-protein kinase [Phialemonium atrogriseum]|uniref:non-specific serine/threonine protein kinase n=1 Tax=Phialemonium atrogriseum TaxID=1093897 RepID=A0AAJ0CBX1_9PEZI|nr:Serine/threonine-protein kinase [Phialemonium atrogriseum]KAK1772447.1 Serine/threonine-protein kinase [Phialemonium atrogriseum]
MASLFRWASSVSRRAPSPARTFSSLRCQLLPESQKIEEETLPDYLAERFYPVHIGEVLASRYQVVGKLGYGTTSTVWLARDLTQHRHVAVKVFIRSAALGARVDHERNVYQRISSGSRSHPGRDAVRPLLDFFQLSGPDGEHQCLVHPPLWENVRTFLARNPVGRLPKPVLGIVLYRLFQALDYLHNECRIVHTGKFTSLHGFSTPAQALTQEHLDIKSDNIPQPPKGSRRKVHLRLPAGQKPKDIGPPVLCDFGGAFFGDILHDNDVQTDQYRCSEVILEIPWSCKIDIWNVGCTIWDIFEGGLSFRGTDLELGVYRGRAHLAEMIALLGPPTPEFLNRGKLRSKFFSESGEWQAGIKPLPPVSLGKLETNLEGMDKELFLQLMGKMLQWAPEDRATPRELLNDPWVTKQVFG